MGSSRSRSAAGSNERDIDGKGMISRAFHEHKSIRGDASGAKYSKLHLTGYSVARARRGEPNAGQTPFLGVWIIRNRFGPNTETDTESLLNL